MAVLVRQREFPASFRWLSQLSSCVFPNSLLQHFYLNTNLSPLPNICSLPLDLFWHNRIVYLRLPGKRRSAWCPVQHAKLQWSEAFVLLNLQFEVYKYDQSFECNRQVERFEVRKSPRCCASDLPAACHSAHTSAKRGMWLREIIRQDRCQCCRSSRKFFKLQVASVKTSIGRRLGHQERWLLSREECSSNSLPRLVVSRAISIWTIFFLSSRSARIQK